MSKPQKFEELQVLTGYEKPADVAACLARNHIKFHYGKHGRPFTTTGLIEQAGLISEKPPVQKDQKQHIEI